jgi:hypothetical protein
MAEDKLLWCDECFAIVVDLDKHKEWHGTVAPEPSPEERANTKLAADDADYRWRNRRMVERDGVDGSPICLHAKRLSGECSICARESIDAGV